MNEPDCLGKKMDGSVQLVSSKNLVDRLRVELVAECLSGTHKALGFLPQCAFPQSQQNVGLAPSVTEYAGRKTT